MDRKCQFLLYCPRWKSLFHIYYCQFLSLHTKIASFILIVMDQNCQFYLHCYFLNKPVLLILSRIKNVSFIYIVTDQNCQFLLHCYWSKLPAFKNLSLYLPIPGREVPKLTITNFKMPNLSFILPIPGQSVPILARNDNHKLTFANFCYQLPIS